MWQKCPICNGEGKLLNYGVATSLFSVCPTCNGTRIISEINGLPPSFTHVEEDYDHKTKSEKNGNLQR
jgi:DnaJ-class molecular chaperone